MSYTATGKLHLKSDTQIVNEKFSKREFVIVTTDQYPQHISFQLTQDKVGLLDKYNAGDDIEVKFNLRGREWTAPDGAKKYFNTLECWALSSPTVHGPNTPETPNIPSSDSVADDLPF